MERAGLGPRAFGGRGSFGTVPPGGLGGGRAFGGGGGLLGAADTQTAHHATFSTAPTHQLLGSANAETTPAEHRPQRPTERSDPTQHAKGRTGDCPGPP